VLSGSLQDVLEMADSKIRQYHRELADGTPQSNGALATGQAGRARTALLRFVLLQWIWFDRRCHFFGKVVSRGLAVAGRCWCVAWEAPCRLLGKNKGNFVQSLNEAACLHIPFDLNCRLSKPAGCGSC
jgi:hypothetical protein